MPTQQEMYIASLVGDMKRAVKRKADESDSEDSIDQITNRGNKLKKKARFVREGQLALPNGPKVYKETIVYNDRYERDIISRRPALYDEDGFELESEDDEDGSALAATSEFYPYSDVRIEELLAPLTSASDLPNHPTLSRPFTSKTLSDLTRHARDMMQKEKKSLWRMKHLLTRLGGDHTWMPTEIFETEHDINLFTDGRSDYREHILGKSRLLEEGLHNPVETIKNESVVGVEAVNGKHPSEVNTNAPVEVVTAGPSSDEDVAMADASTGVIGETRIQSSTIDETSAKDAENPSTNGVSKEPIQSENPEANLTASVEQIVENGQEKTEKPEIKEDANAAPKPADDNQAEEVEDPDTTMIDEAIAEAEAEEEVAEVEEEVEIPEPRRMRTRAQAQAASDNSNSSRTASITIESNESYVHPYFLAPISSIPDRDISLPTLEAEETRRILQLYIQKQEEICRGSQKLYEGLLKADRMRHAVMKWAKADAHTGENGLSDGEDWYDKEEWNLTEDLKKGQDEEEEDAATTAKKTRTRRQ